MKHFNSKAEPHRRSWVTAALLMLPPMPTAWQETVSGNGLHLPKELELTHSLPPVCQE